MTMHMYITISEEDRIARYEVDAATGTLSHVGDTGTGARPAPLAVNPAGDRLYAGCRDAIAISTYAIGDGGELAHIGDVPVDNDPCYLATDRGGRFLLSAYYEGGRCAVHAIGDDGAAAFAAGGVAGDGQGGALHADGRVESVRVRAAYIGRQWA